MRGIIWLVLLFAVAVVAATTLGRNDGLVSIYFGAWRTDLSLNLFVLLNGLSHGNFPSPAPNAIYSPLVGIN